MSVVWMLVQCKLREGTSSMNATNLASQRSTYRINRLEMQGWPWESLMLSAKYSVQVESNIRCERKSYSIALIASSHSWPSHQPSSLTTLSWGMSRVLSCPSDVSPQLDQQTGRGVRDRHLIAQQRLYKEANHSSAECASGGKDGDTSSRSNTLRLLRRTGLACC